MRKATKAMRRIVEIQANTRVAIPNLPKRGKVSRDNDTKEDESLTCRSFRNNATRMRWSTNGPLRLFTMRGD